MTPALHSLLLALILVAVGERQSRGDGFFDGPPATPGPPMFFSVYSIQQVQHGNFNLQKAADGGFSAAGPHYHAANGGDPINNATTFYARVAEAAEEDLGFVAHIPWHPGVINDTAGDIRPNSMAAIPEASLRAHVRQVMDFTLNHPQANATTEKWYVLPEELRPWKTAEMNYLQIVADEVRKYDPLGRPVSMYNPQHRTQSELNSIVGEGLDETLMGVYVTAVPFATRGARIALGVDRIVAAAAHTSTTPVMGVQLSEDFDAVDLLGLRTALGGVSEAQAIQHVLRHDVYQGLLRGIQGVQIWSGCDCRAGLTTYSQQLEGYISVSTDLNLGLHLSDVFLRGDARTDFAATVLSGPTSVAYVGSPANYTIPTVTLADIAYGGDRYLFLANSSNSLLTLRVDSLPPGVLGSQINDLFDNSPELAVDSATGTMQLNMQPLEVIALRIAPITELAGDYNGDGAVDAADYVVWRKNGGTHAEFQTWRQHFGARQAAAASLGELREPVVPEPIGITLWMTGSPAASWFASRRRQRVTAKRKPFPFQ